MEVVSGYYNGDLVECTRLSSDRAGIEDQLGIHGYPGGIYRVTENHPMGISVAGINGACHSRSRFIRAKRFSIPSTDLDHAAWLQETYGWSEAEIEEAMDFIRTRRRA